MNKYKELFIIGSVVFCVGAFGTLAIQITENMSEMAVIRAICAALFAGFTAVASNVFKKEKAEDGSERQVLALSQDNAFLKKQIEEATAQIKFLSTSAKPVVVDPLNNS